MHPRADKRVVWEQAINEMKSRHYAETGEPYVNPLLNLPRRPAPPVSPRFSFLDKFIACLVVIVVLVALVALVNAVDNRTARCNERVAALNQQGIGFAANGADAGC